MTEPEVDPIIALLPWHLSGKLQPAELDCVRERLAHSEEARRELESRIVLRRDLVSMMAAEPPPSAHAREEILLRVRGTGPFDWLAEAGRRALAPKWMPAAASAVILAQLGLWLAPRFTAGPAPIQTMPATRGLQPASTRFRLTTVPQANQQQLTAILRTLGAQIVGGPDAAGAWTLEIPSDDPGLAEEVLAEGRAHAEIVLAIETIPQ